MEQLERYNDHEHVIIITRNSNASSESTLDDQSPGMHIPQHDDLASDSTRISTYQTPMSSSTQLNSRNSSFTRRGEGYDHRRRSPLNSGLWISVELVVTLGQIVASIVVLSLSRNEHPHAPLFAWVVGYASGCVASLSILYWRYQSNNQPNEQDFAQLHQDSPEGNLPEHTSHTTISINQAHEEENHYATEPTARSSRIPRPLSSRLNRLIDHFKMALDCFFAVWFVVGNVWIFGGHSSPSDAPKLYRQFFYRLCIVFLTFSCIGYAMPFILCATICCCLPCIISVLGSQEDFSQKRGATLESINALPIYKFKLKKNEIVTDQDDNAGRDEGGILAAGTEKQRAISAEDAVCCICLEKYADDDELRELPCFHVFHVECVDKWLKINGCCPLCKSEVGERSGVSPAEDSNQR